MVYKWSGYHSYFHLFNLTCSLPLSHAGFFAVSWTCWTCSCLRAFALVMSFAWEVLPLLMWMALISFRSCSDVTSMSSLLTCLFKKVSPLPISLCLPSFLSSLYSTYVSLPPLKFTCLLLAGSLHCKQEIPFLLFTAFSQASTIVTSTQSSKICWNDFPEPTNSLQLYYRY